MREKNPNDIEIETPISDQESRWVGNKAEYQGSNAGHGGE
jgi:hypothetical protein